MKKKLIAPLLFLVCFFHFNTILSQTSRSLVTWDFNGKTGQASIMANFVTGGVSTVSPSSVVLSGSGINAPAWANGLLTKRTPVTLADAISQKFYMSFTITPDFSLPISFTSVRLFTYSQDSKPRKFTLYSSVKGFNEADSIGSITWKGAILQTIPVSGHDNLTTSTEFRIYIYGAADYWLEYYKCCGIGNARTSSDPYDLAVEGFIPDVEKPSVPQGLKTTTVTTGYLNLLWNASTDNVGVSEYEVFKDGVSVGTTSDTTFSVINLSKSTDYSFTVKAKDAFGNVSEPSDALAVTTLSTVIVKNEMGINLFYASDWCKENAFADVMKLGREWYNVKSEKATLDEHGWPTEDACVIIWHGIDQMNGKYKLRFTGQADVAAYWLNSKFTNKVYDPVTNTTTVDFENLDNVHYGVIMNFTNTKGGVKNVQMMRPVDVGGSVCYDFNTTFTTPFKNMFSKFSTIRFLNWSRINGCTDSTWISRTPQDYYWASKENRIIPWETVIQLCNETNCDGWINVPVKATDDYVRELALLFKKNLNPGLKVYVEYCNELWNSSGGFFSSYINNLNAANAEVATGNSSLNFDGETSVWYLAWRRTAKRAVEISNIFREVWGDEAMMTRVRPVLMWQQGDAQNTATEALKWLEYNSSKTNKPINYYLYGAGGSAYYGPDNNCDTLTIDNIWQSFTYNTDNWIENNTKDIFVVKAMGCKRLAYEGGPSMDNYGHSEVVKAAAWADPKMKDVFIDHHTFWSQYGGDLLMYYCTTGDYSWGFTYDCHNLNTPKFNAIDALNETDKCPAVVGHSIPFTVNGGAFDYANPTWFPKSTGYFALSKPSQCGGYLMRSGSGKYHVSMEYSGATDAVVQFMVDNILIGEETINGTGKTSAYTMNLEAGVHSLRVIQKSSTGFTIKTVSVGTGPGLVTSVRNNDINQETLISLYPNPANDYVNISISAKFGSTACVSVYDMLGKEVRRTNNVLNNGAIHFPTGTIANGIYTLKIVMNNKSYIEKLVVRK